MLPDFRLGVRVEVDDGGMVGITDDVHRSRDGFVERVGAVREELDEVSGLDRTGRGAGDVGRLRVEGCAVRRAEPDAPAEVGELGGVHAVEGGGDRLASVERGGGRRGSVAPRRERRDERQSGREENECG
ncbi:MAG: hypothetical protein F4075_13865 [Acidobacteria bacterium]|nr:hypothetical protein [Acidobacteriota bacterium]